MASRKAHLGANWGDSSFPFLSGLALGTLATAVAMFLFHGTEQAYQKLPCTDPKLFNPSPIGRQPLDLQGLRKLAKQRLAAHVWEYISYTSGAGQSVQNAIPNAFGRWQLRPRILQGRRYATPCPGVQNGDKALGTLPPPAARRAVKSGRVSRTTATSLLGKLLDAPLLVAPTAFHGLCHRGGEAATAHGVARAGVGYCYNFSLAHVAAADVVEASRCGSKERLRARGVAEAKTCGTKWAHIYLWKDRAYVLWTLREAERLGFDAVIVTCDHPHDRVKEATMPIFEPHEHTPLFPSHETHRESKKTVDDMKLGNTVSEVMHFANLESYRRSRAGSTATGDAGTNLEADDGSAGENDGGLTFDDLAWVCHNTSLPVVCKGILTPEDALLAAQAGCRGICVSNHGGRQMDGAVPAIEALVGIIECLRKWNLLEEGGQSKSPSTHEKAAQSGKMIVLVDTGFRTGTQILVALALGAHAVMIGRPVLWGLAAGGSDGVFYVFDRLRKELEWDMQSVGVESITDLHRRGPHDLLVDTRPIHLPSLV